MPRPKASLGIIPLLLPDNERLEKSSERSSLRHASENKAILRGPPVPAVFLTGPYYEAFR